MGMLVAKRRGAGSALTALSSGSGSRTALTNNVVVSYPADSESGDLIIVAVLSYRNSTTAYTITTPTGWSLLGEFNGVTAAGTRIALYSRVRSTETSVTISASATLFWIASSYGFKNFYAPDPIESVGNIQLFVGESSNWATTPILLGAPCGVLHMGGGALNATTATTETWGRGTKLADNTVLPSTPAIRLVNSGAYEYVPSAGVVSSNPLVHNNRRANQWGATVAIRPANYVPSAPHLTALSAETGATTGGTAITITGTGFQASTTVRVDGVAIPSGNVTVTNSRTLAVTMPAGTAGVKDVTVQTAAGTSNAMKFKYVTLTPLGMNKSGTQALGTTTGEFKITGWAVQAGTPSGSIVNDELVVNGTGNITISVTGMSFSSTLSMGGLRLRRNGVQIATTTSLSTISWTGDVTAGDSISLYVAKNTTSSRTVNAAGQLSYTVNSGGGTPTTTTFFTSDFAGTGSLDSSLFFTSGGGVHERVNGELSGDNTPSIPISFTWLRQPVPTQDVILRTRLRWNGRNPEHSASGLAIRGRPFDDTGNPGVHNGIMFVCTATIMSLYYEDYDVTNGFVSLTGQQYVNTTKFPENALLELRVSGTTVTAFMNGVQQLTGPSNLGQSTNRYVGLTIQNDILEAGGGEAPARLDDFEVLTVL